MHNFWIMPCHYAEEDGMGLHACIGTIMKLIYVKLVWAQQGHGYNKRETSKKTLHLFNNEAIISLSGSLLSFGQGWKLSNVQHVGKKLYKIILKY